MSECLLEKEYMIDEFDSSDIQNSCIEEDPQEEVAGSTGAVSVGIFGGGPDGGGTPVTWQNKFFNQLLISPWSCFYMANWTALSNTFNIDIPFSVIQDGWNDLVANGKFIPGVGGKMSDGTFYALKHFNLYTSKNVQSRMLPFNIKNIVAALQARSDFVFGLKYGKGFAKNEQDDGIIQASPDNIGSNGHLVCGVKANTKLDHLLKYVEQYHGVVPHDIILVDIDKNAGLFMNNLTYFVGG